MIAFSEYGERPLVIIYDVELERKRKILRCPELKSFQVGKSLSLDWFVLFSVFLRIWDQPVFMTLIPFVLEH